MRPSVKFIHTADWQIGMTRHFLSSGVQGEFGGDRVNTIRRIGEVAKSCGAEFVLTCGDVFESNRIPGRDIAQALDAMREVELPIYLLPGNHDTLGPNSIYDSTDFTSKCPSNVIVLRESGQYIIRDGLELLAAPWVTKHPGADPLSGLSELLENLTADGTIRIVVGHGMLEELEPDKSKPDAIRRGRLDEALARGAIDYVALGDRHIRWPADDSGAIHYSGTHEATQYQEKERGQVLEVTIDDSLRIVHHQVGQWQFKQLHFDLTSADDLVLMANELAEVSRPNRTILKIQLTGALTIAQAAKLDELLADQSNRFAALETRCNSGQLIIKPGQEEFGDIEADGYLRESIDELTDLAGTGDESASQALRLLYQILQSEGLV